MATDFKNGRRVFDRYGNRNFIEANTTTIPKNCGTSPNFTVCAADRKVFNPSVAASTNRINLDQDGDSVNDYAFDPSGNTTKDANGRTFVYDAENKQVEVKSASNETIGQYWYDGDGRRVKKRGWINGQWEETIFVYDASSRLVAEYSTILNESPQVAYLTTDHLGSPRINTNENGAVVSRTDYMPYGEEIIGLGGRSTTDKYVGDDVRQGFTGYLNDEETNLDYAQARMYKKELGRFSGADPLHSSGRIENPQTWNRYAYVLNNPHLYTDPFGLYEWADSAGGAWTDEQLEEGTKSKHKSLRKWARRAISFRQRFKTQLERAKSAIASGNLSLEQKRQVQESTDSYGEEHDQNGVFVGIRLDRNGDTISNGPKAITLLNEDDTVSVDFRLDVKDDELVATIAHEGRHVADD